MFLSRRLDIFSPRQGGCSEVSHLNALVQINLLHNSQSSVSICAAVELEPPRKHVVVVVDSHIQRIVLATEETTVTQQVSHRPIKCQSRLWSQRGTKVNGSHHGDNPLLRLTGIQIATKSYAALQYKQWHQPISKRFFKPPYSISRATSIDSECCRLPTTSVLSKKNGKMTLQPVLINKSKFLKATHCTEARKIEIPRSMVVEALSW